MIKSPGVSSEKMLQLCEAIPIIVDNNEEEVAELAEGQAGKEPCDGGLGGPPGGKGKKGKRKGSWISWDNPDLPATMQEVTSPVHGQTSPPAPTPVDHADATDEPVAPSQDDK